MKYSKNLSQTLLKPFLSALALLFIFVSCSENTGISPEAELTEFKTKAAQSSMLSLDAEYTFTGPVFDISALPNGGILVADFATIKEIQGNTVREITTLPLVEGEGAFGEPDITLINGLEPIGNGGFFATRSGLDLAVGAGLLRATRGKARLVVDIESFTIGDWPEGDPGQKPEWKNLECEPPGGFSAGPQTNPYHLTGLSGSEVLIASAAGNVLLYAKTNGQIEVVATFDPIVDPDTGERLVQFPLNAETDCPVEPVPTSVAVGADGAYYVGELTGATAENFAGNPTPEGLASVWRIESGSRDVVCPSDECQKVVTGLNSIIDIEFGPDGYLYVVEYEKNGFLATVAPDFNIPLAGGTVKKCDVVADSCVIIEGKEGDLFLPGAITFDKWDNLWLLDNVFGPTVRQIEWH